jgi:hypothetical protein
MGNRAQATEAAAGSEEVVDQSGKLHPRPGHVLASKQPPIPFLQDFEIVDLRTGETENMRFPRDPNASAFNTINCGCMMVLHAPPASEIFSSRLRTS